MVNNKILDEMNLPWSSSNETLEIISNNYFRKIFDPNDFLIRQVTERDKGIDHYIEIKRKNKFLNFHFVIQLKATDSKNYNNDGSISLQLSTSNINYLLNNPMPAFYVLFFNQTKTFYYENINEFVQTLYKKNKNWNSQSSHVLRFSKILNKEAIKEIYHLTLERGKVQRTITEKTIMQSLAINKGDKLIIDGNLNITDDKEIREFIENNGLILIDDRKWQDIIQIHKNASGNVACTSKYNLVLGIANYYNGNLIEALSFFKASLNSKLELTEEFRNYLIFFDTTVKFSIGLITYDEYYKEMQKLENSNNIGLYIQLEKEKRKYIKHFKDSPTNSYIQFVSEVNAIISKAPSNKNFKLNAKAELILFEGYNNNMEYIKGISRIKAIEEIRGPYIPLRIELLNNISSAHQKWLKNVLELKQEAINTKNYFAYFIVIINEVRVLYEFDIYTSLISIVENTTKFSKTQTLNEALSKNLIKKISRAIDYFKYIGHIENTVMALSIKYEILHYSNQNDDAKAVLNNLELTIEKYGLIEHKKKLQKLKNNGTTHQLFKIFLDRIFKESEAKKQEYEEMIKEIKKMDKDESKFKNESLTDSLLIELFPLGYFKIPIEQKNTAYEILNITKEARKKFDEMFKIVIPVANIFYNPIIQEGYIDGNLRNTGINTWRNIFRIRKSFYQNKFYKQELKF